MSDYTLSGSYEEKSQTWKKSSPTDFCSKYSNTLSLNDENEKCWKKNSSSNATNNSTLSLRISAYENEASSDSLNKSFQKSLLIQKQKQINPASKFVSQSPFEFQRQQNDKVPEPEVSQFKASQQLLDSNKSDLPSDSAMDNNSDSKENYESVNNLPVHHAVDYEIKHRDVHVADWSHEIGDQDSIDSHRVPYNNSLPAYSKPPQRVRTFSRGSKNPQNRNRSRNRQQSAQNSNCQNYEPQQRRSYTHNPQYRQSSANPQYRNRQQPPVYNTNVQPSHSATTSQTFILLSKNSEVQRKVTIPTTSNDVRLDKKFMNGSNQTFVPRQIFAPQTDSFKPQYHQKDGKHNKQRNDQPQTSIKTVTPSTSQVFKKQVEKTFRKSFQGKMAPKPSQSVSKEGMATKSCVSKERMASKVNQSDSKDKVVLPSTSEVNVKQDQKIPEAPKPIVKKSNPFGNARPVDTHKKMIEIEQKKLDEQNYSSNNTFITFRNNST